MYMKKVRIKLMSVWVIIIMVVNSITINVSAMEVKSVENYNLNFEKDFSFQASNMNAIVKGNNIYVAIGESGSLKISSNGKDWEGIDSTTGQSINSIIWTGEYFVAVGDKGTIIYSNNGRNWNKTSDTEGSMNAIINGKQVTYTYGLTQDLHSIVYSNKNYIAGGKYGELWTSKDLKKWQPIISDSIKGLQTSNVLGQNATVKSLGNFKNGISALVSKSNYGDYILYSPDGITWKNVYTDPEVGNLLDFTENNDGAVILTKGNGYLQSNDGIKWDKKILTLNTGEYAKKLKYENGKYYILGNIRYANRTYYSGIDLSNINKLNIAIDRKNNNTTNDMIIENDSFILVGDDGVKTSIENNAEVISKIGLCTGQIEGIVSDAKGNIAVATADGLFSGQFGKMINVVNESFTDIKSVNNKFIAISNSGIWESGDLVNWNNTVSEYNYNINSISYGNGTYVAVGKSGKIIKSLDSKVWDVINSNTQLDLNKVIYNGSYFVAVGANGIVLKSNDGITWSQTLIEVNKENQNLYGNEIRDILWDGEKLIAVGDMISVSCDGITWNEINYAGDLLSLKSIFKYNDLIVACNTSGEILISNDGYDWEKSTKGSNLGINVNSSHMYNKDFAVLGGTGGLYKVKIEDNRPNYDYNWVYDKNVTRFRLNSIADNEKIAIAVGDSGHIKISNDGVKWMTVDSGITGNLTRVKYINGKFFVLGEGGVILESKDGQVWTKLKSKVNKTLNDIVYNNGKYLIIGENGTTLTSTNAVDWKIETGVSGRNVNLMDVMYFNNKFIAFGKEFNSRIFTSMDAISWEEVKLPYGFVYGIKNVATNGNKIVMGDSDSVKISSDGINWVKKGEGVNGVVHYVNNKFITYNYGQTYYSTDSETWTKSEILGGDFSTPVGVTTFKDKVIGVTDNVNGGSNMAISNDGLKWEEVQLNIDAQGLNEAKWLGGRFIVGGNKDTLLTSFDGLNWNKGEGEGIVSTSSVDWNGQMYVAGGVLGSVGVSKNADNWSRVQLPIKNPYSTWVINIKWIDNEFIAVCDSGEVLQSYDGYNWTNIYNLNERILGISKTVKFNNKYYILLGTQADNENTLVLEATDKKNWVKSKINLKLKDLIVKNNRLVAIGTLGKVYNSNDMKNWVNNESANLKGGPSNFIESDDSIYLFEGTNGILESKDGITWTSTNISNMNYFVESGATNGNAIVGVGNQSSIFMKNIGQNTNDSRIDIIGDSFVKTSKSEVKVKNSAYLYNLLNKRVADTSKITWSIKTSLKNISINSKTGEITIPANSQTGTIELKASVSDKVYSIKTINVGTNAEFTLDKINIILRAGEEADLSIKVSGGGWPIDVIYSSSNNQVAKVDVVGKITANAAGNSNISVMKKNSSFEQNANIKVVDAEDVNKDENIDIEDIAKIALLYDTKSTDEKYNKLNDFNKDNIIDIFDIILIARKCS